MQKNYKKRHSLFSDDEEEGGKTSKMLATLKERHEQEEQEELQGREELEQTVLEEAQDNQEGFFEVEEKEEREVEEKKPDKNRRRISFNQQMPFQQALPEDSMKGYLMKQSPHLLRGWQKRYVVVQDRKLSYYKDREEGGRQLMGYLDFDSIRVHCSVTFSKGQVRRVKLQPQNCKKVFTFKSADKEHKDLKEWNRVVEANIQNSAGITASQSHDFTAEKRFWRHKRISNEQFMKKADSLDLLLFKGLNVAAKLQRSLTGSNYDHVALILRYGSGDIYLFEAVGQTGVGLCRWSTFCKKSWNKLYDKLVFRHLALERHADTVDQLQKYVKKQLGKKYSVSAEKLLRNQSKSNQEEEDSTFFCSQLVAACYKKLGLLPDQPSACQYWPGSFAAEKSLKLTNGDLEEELLIDFSGQ